MQKFRPANGDKGLPVLKIRELGQGACGNDTERCDSHIDESVKVHDGDLIFSWSGTLLLGFWAGGDAGLNQHLFKVTSEQYPSWLYYAWTKYHLARFIALAKDRATTMGHIKRSALAESEVLLPSASILAQQTATMQPIVEQIVRNMIENHKLAELRDTLLPKLMSGEIDVSKVNLTQLNSHLAALWSCGRRSRRLSWVSVVTDANDMSNPGHRVTLTADQFAGANPMAGDGTTAALRLGRRHRRGLLGLAYIQLLWARGLILLHDALSRPLNRHPVCTPDGPT